jgi:hypothetical protein
MPATGKEMNVGDIEQMEPNTHAGVKYVRSMVDKHYAKETMTPVNEALFAFEDQEERRKTMGEIKKKAA